MSSSLTTIQKYTFYFQTLTVHVSSYKQVVGKFAPKHGLKFIPSSYRDGVKIESAQEKCLTSCSSITKRREHSISHSFKAYYICHRGEEQKERAGQPKGGREVVNGSIIILHPLTHQLQGHLFGSVRP